MSDRTPRNRAPQRRPDRVRQLAYQVIRQVNGKDGYANLALNKALRDSRIGGRDAAFCTELVHGTLRWQGTYDAFLARSVSRPLTALDPELLDLLRLGTHQLLRMRVDSYAAVDEMVTLTRAEVGHKRSGLVNAVLRKISQRSMDQWIATVAPPADQDPVGHLAIAKAHPRWVIEAFNRALGEPAGEAPPPRPSGPTGGESARAGSTGEGSTGGDSTSGGSTEGGSIGGASTGGGSTGDSPAGRILAGGLVELLDADNEPPRVTLVARPGLAEVDELLEAGAIPARWSPYAAVLPSGDPGRIGAVATGRAGVQDEGSQLVAVALATAPLDGRDSSWLDLCAGPGGKSALLAAVLNQRTSAAKEDDQRPAAEQVEMSVDGQVDIAQLPGGVSPGLTAVEPLKHRAELVRANLRVVPGKHRVLVGDGTKPTWPDAAYDRVLADVPCSGLGALRRRPEARWRRSPQDVIELRPLQEDLLDSAITSVRPGGVVAYVTCSPHPDETRAIVDAVLSRRDDVRLEDARELFPGVPCLGPGPDVQLWPHVHGTDAMYLALLRRS